MSHEEIGERWKWAFQFEGVAENVRQLSGFLP